MSSISHSTGTDSLGIGILEVAEGRHSGRLATAPDVNVCIDDPGIHDYVQGRLSVGWLA